MRRFLLIPALALVVLGCGKDNSTQPAVPPSDASIAASLWQRMTSEGYTVAGPQWAMFPAKAGIYEPDVTLLGSDPHLGPTHFRTFANASAQAALASHTFPLPDQSIIAKQNFIVSGPDTMLAAITVMLKQSGYHPAGGDWFWVKFKPDGQAEVSGKVTMCVGCHQGASTHYDAQRDYVWTRTR